MNGDFELTDRTTEQIVPGLTGNWSNDRLLAFGPTVGTKVITPELDRKVRKALQREVRRIKIRLKLRLLGLYICKFALEFRKFRNHAMRYFVGHLAKFVDQSHRTAS
jgi:hypothetical protein